MAAGCVFAELLVGLFKHAPKVMRQVAVEHRLNSDAIVQLSLPGSQTFLIIIIFL